MHKILFLFLICLLFSCEVTPPERYTPPVPDDENPLVNTSALFIPGAEGVVSLKTNDPQYYSNHGYSLWCLQEEGEVAFTNREVGLSKLSGNAGAGYGLICCYRNDPVYGKTMLVVLINTVKEYTVAEITGNAFEELVPWQESVLLKSGYNQRNLIRLEYKADTTDYLLYINSELAKVFRDDKAPFHTGGRQGYLVVISPLDDFPGFPVEVQFEEIELF